jgi:hypothetical protein
VKPNQNWQCALDRSIHRNEYLLNDDVPTLKDGEQVANSYVAE